MAHVVRMGDVPLKPLVTYTPPNGEGRGKAARHPGET
jgi:hypothetical protein